MPRSFLRTKTKEARRVIKSVTKSLKKKAYSGAKRTKKVVLVESKKKISFLGKRARRVWRTKAEREFLVGLSGLLILSTIFYAIWPSGTPLYGATYTFDQQNWSGGLDAVSTANHGSNQSNWTKYSSSSNTSLNNGNDISLSTTTASIVQTNSGSENTGFALNGYSTTQTQVSGTGDSASVNLSQQSFAVSTSTVQAGDHQTSMVMGLDNLPRFISTQLLNFTKCNDSSCSSKSVQNLSPYSNSIVSMAMGVDGFPLIAYSNNNTLIFIKCNNDTCSSNTSSTIATNVVSGNLIEIKTGTDGFARLVYVGVGTALADDIKFIQCLNAACTSRNNQTVLAGEFERVGWEKPHLEVGSDGFVRIIANQHDDYDGIDQGTVFVLCQNATCSSKATNGVRGGDGNLNVSMDLGQDDNARIVTIFNSRLIHQRCLDSSCSSRSSSTLPNIGAVALPDIEVGSDGVSYVSNRPSTQAGFYKCSNLDCSSGTYYSVDSTGYWGILGLTSSNLPYFLYSVPNNKMLAYPVTSYYSSGTFVSGPIDLGFETPSWGTLIYAASSSAGRTVSIKARSNPTSDFSGATSWSGCGTISSGANLSSGNCVTNGHRYIQYEASFTTNNLTITPTLDSVTVSYSSYSSFGFIISSSYDTLDPTNVMGGVSWDEDINLPSGSTVAISLRTASDQASLTNSSWTDFATSTTNCSKSGQAVTCSSAAIPNGMKDGSGDRWLQYKISLSSSGVSTPTISAVRVTYVVNAPPQYNPDYNGGNSYAVQVATSSDPNFGKVSISYSVRDPDATTGTLTPGYITPSFEYNTGSGWVSIASSSLAAGDGSNKSVDQTTYTTYSATWDAKTDAPGLYSSNALIRVKANDNEAANNIAYSTSTSFVLDTKNPVISSFRVDSATDTLVIAATDDTNIQYRLSNVADFSSSSDWIAASGTSLSVNKTDWTFPGGSSAETIYLQVRDAYGNTASASVVAPPIPQNLDLRDISNISTEEYREFISWKVHTNTEGATFSKYELWRSTDNITWSIRSNITDISQNYFTDYSVSTSSTYYYRVSVLDTDGDRSSYSSVLSDQPDGQGGTDFTAPVISNVSTTERQTSWVKITWTTDEISYSSVDYSEDESYGNNVSSQSLVTDHSIIIRDLTPNTTYNFRVKSTDYMGNERVSSGHSFITPGGPVISAVAVQSVNDNSASITWNTDRSANSYVIYSTNANNLRTNNPPVSTMGSGTFVVSPFEHRVTLNNLSRQTTYFFYVKSTDADTGFESIENNSGTFFTFNTTNDSKAPTISGVDTPVLAPTAASVTWMTDELADTYLEYGTSEGNYTQATNYDTTMSIYHVTSLSALIPKTQYFFRVRSRDASGNESFATSTLTTTQDVQYVSSNRQSGDGDAVADVSGPDISGIEVLETNAFGGMIKFVTSELSNAFVQFSDGKIFGSPKFKTDHKVTVFGLKNGATYEFQIEAVDKSGNSTVSTVYTITTKFAAEDLDELTKLENAEQFADKIENLIESTLPSLVPPIITDIEVKEITGDSAEIYWKTNVRTFGSVGIADVDQYKADKPNDYAQEISDTEEKTRTHKVSLLNLKPGTLYNFQVRSFALPGVIGRSSNKTFATKAQSMRAEALKVSNNGFTMTWETSTETSSFVEYRNIRTGEVGQVGVEDKSKRHLVEVKNVAPNSTYSVRVFGYDANGTLIEGERINVSTKNDTTPPSITGLTINSAFMPYRANQLQTVISWKTDEPSTSKVEYEEGISKSDKLQNKTEQPEMVTQHVVVVPGFKPSTVYRIKITSVDAAGNVAETPIRTIITPGSNESVFDVIIKNFEDAFGFLKNVGN